MIFEGEEHFSGGIEEVWNALHDTDLLTRTVPGCKSITLIRANEYTVALSLGVAAVRGEYEGKLKVIDVKRPVHYMVKGDGSGAPGFVNVNVNCYLEPQATGTLLKWHCEANVGGMIAGIGGKALSGIAKFMAKQFFTAFKAGMSERPNLGGAAYSPVAKPAGVSASMERASATSWFARLLAWLGLRQAQS